MSVLVPIATGAVALLAAGTLAACGSGGSSDGRVVARVGGAPISRSVVIRWSDVLEGGQPGSHASVAHAQSLRRQALALLIARRWLIGEAADRGITIAPSEVHRQVGRIESAEFPGGGGEQREFMKATGETAADFELQARAELASAKLRQMAVESAPEVTLAQIAAYYAEHKHNFLLPERREARFRNRKSKAEAEQIKREVEAGKSLTSPAQRLRGELFTGARVPPSNPWEKAIDLSKPHVLSGPFHIQDDFWLYEVVKVIPAHQRTLAEVAGSIRRKLSGERRQQALTQLIGTWTARWTAKTDCRPGYVIQRCRQYRGPMASEDPLTVQ